MVINSIQAQIYKRNMKGKFARQFQDSAGHEIVDTQWSWNQSNVLREKNGNSTVCFSRLQSQPFSKKLFLANKTLHSKIQKLPLQQDNSFLKVEQLTSHSKIYQHARRKSNIQLLKRQIQYLEQDSFHKEQFPKTTCYPFYPSNSRSSQKQGKSSQKQGKKCVLMPSKGEEGATEVIKGFTGGPLKCVSQPEQKLKRKWLKSKEKKQRSQQKQNSQIKSQFKYEVMLPYSKYFPANRFRKNRSSTMKVDELLGRRVSKVTHMSAQQTAK